MAVEQFVSRCPSLTFLFVIISWACEYVCLTLEEVVYIFIFLHKMMNIIFLFQSGKLNDAIDVLMALEKQTRTVSSMLMMPVVLMILTTSF